MDLFYTTCFGSVAKLRNVAACKVANKILRMKFSMLNLNVFWNLMRFGFGMYLLTFWRDPTVYIFREGSWRSETNRQ